MSDWRLCFVDEPWAYFTTAPITDVYGDDWDDAPHDCNAGPPYGDWPLLKVAQDAWDLEVVQRHPKTGEYLSADQINRGDAPWLVGRSMQVHAGVTLDKFERLVRRAGGSVYR